MKHRPPNRQRRRQVQVRASPTTSTDASKPEAIEAPVPESPALTEVSRPTTIPWMPVLYVSSLIFFCAWYMAPSLFRSWFFSSDEYVIVAEIIRFLHLDFRQHFFERGPRRIYVGQTSDDFKHQKLSTYQVPLTLYVKGRQWVARGLLASGFRWFFPPRPMKYPALEQPITTEPR